MSKKEEFDKGTKEVKKMIDAIPPTPPPPLPPKPDTSSDPSYRDLIDNSR